jgi:flagellar biosynthesis GTPase FlhF
MNPKEFGWSTDQNVTVKNPTSDDFKFRVHGKEYIIGAGETVRMPGFMAWLFVYNMAELLAQKNNEYDNRWIDETVRAKYYQEVIVKVDDLIQQIEAVEPDPIERGDALKQADEAAKAAEEKRAADAKAAGEKQAAEEKAASEKAEAERVEREKAEAEKAAAEKAEQDKADAEAKAAEEKREADAKAALDKAGKAKAGSAA